MGLFIPHDKLVNLKQYKYSSEDHSYISKVILKRWWSLFVLVFPEWMAPNLITLLGLGFVLANLACVFYYDPYLNTPSPKWCYFFYAFGLFMYQTFDGCDGAHARRTGQSGPLGELFDHCIDALNTTLASLVFASVFQLGYSWLLVIAQLASVCNFYASTWEEYHTHTLYLSEFSGPVEGILIICAFYIVTGIVGPSIWNTHLFDLDLKSINMGTVSISTQTLYVVGGLGQLYFNTVSAMRNVAKHYQLDVKLLKSKTAKSTDLAFFGLVPFFAYYAAILLLVTFYPEIVTDYGFALVLNIGLTIAFSVGRIILAHLTIQDFPYFQPPMLLPLFQLIIAKILIGIYEYERSTVVNALMWVGVGMAGGIHFVFVAEIILEITTYLDIYALSIKHKKM